MKFKVIAKRTNMSPWVIQGTFEDQMEAETFKTRLLVLGRHHSVAIEETGNEPVTELRQHTIMSYLRPEDEQLIILALKAYAEHAPDQRSRILTLVHALKTDTWLGETSIPPKEEI